MPLGMAAPAASAAPVHHHASMPMQHCPEQAPMQRTKSAFAACTMACASALPAFDRADDDIGPVARISFALMSAHPLHGLHPDTATPPPKAA